MDLKQIQNCRNPFNHLRRHYHRKGGFCMDGFNSGMGAAQDESQDIPLIVRIRKNRLCNGNQEVALATARWSQHKPAGKFPQ